MRLSLTLLKGPRRVDDALRFHFLAGLPARQTEGADHVVRAVGCAAGEHHATAGGRRVPSGLEHARLADELRAVVRPQTEDATSEIVGQSLHVDGGQATNGS